jgi:hypothetical protein
MASKSTHHVEGHVRNCARCHDEWYPSASGTGGQGHSM